MQQQADDHVPPHQHSAHVLPGQSAALTRNSRRRIILMALALQAVALAIGWTVLFQEVRSRIAEHVRGGILKGNATTLEAVSKSLMQSVDAPLEFGSAPWEVAQSIIEGLELRAGAFACLIDQSGNIICHPDMRDNPQLRSVNLGTERLHAQPSDAGTPILELAGEETASGSIEVSGGGTHYIATREIPGIQARLIVHQPVGRLVTVSEALASQLSWISGFIGTLVLGVTGLTTLTLLRRHDRELEAINAGLEAEIALRVNQSMSIRDALIFGLAKLADFRDNDTGTHLERIAEYSEILAANLATRFPMIDRAYIRRLRLASAMHDIGKVGVEDAILLKPGRLTEEERSHMQLHPGMGADTLIAIRERLGRDDLVEMAIVIALEHHERWDGSGYPLGLQGEQIQLPARIVALADVYDALTSRRVYKAAMTHEAAVKAIIEGKGSHFDPMVVEAFEACAREFEGRRAKLQSQPQDSSAPFAGVVPLAPMPLEQADPHSPNADTPSA